MRTMKQILFVVIITLIMITGLMAQTNEMESEFRIGITTKGYEVFHSGVGNGKAWQKLGLQSHITYITGINEGLVLAEREGLNTERFQPPSGFRMSDLVQQIDKFYSDSANLRIPVIEAYVYTIKKLHGDSLKDLTDLETLLRKTYNK